MSPAAYWRSNASGSCEVMKVPVPNPASAGARKPYRIPAATFTAIAIGRRMSSAFFTPTPPSAPAANRGLHPGFGQSLISTLPSENTSTTLLTISAIGSMTSRTRPKYSNCFSRARLQGMTAGNDDHQTRMNLLFRIQRQEVFAAIGDEDEVALADHRHEIGVERPLQAAKDDMGRMMMSCVRQRREVGR